MAFGYREENEIPFNIMQKDAESLGKEILDWMEQKYHKLDYLYLTEFWEDKYHLDFMKLAQNSRFQAKYFESQRFASEFISRQIREKKEREKEVLLEQQKAQALGEVQNILDWLKEKGVKITKANLSVYLFEKKIKFPPVIREILLMEIKKHQ